MNRKKKIVLTYHHVIPDELFDHSNHLGVSHSQTNFKEQVKLISQRFAGKEQAVSRCLITFDDGYKNQFEIAAKILNQYGLKGLFFVSFQSITTGYTLLIDKILMWISYVPPGIYTILSSQISIIDENRFLVAASLYDQLIKNSELWDTIEEDLNRSFAFHSLNLNPTLARLRFMPLEIEDLEALVKEGHLIGSHGWSHLPLSTLPLAVQKEDFSSCIALASRYCNTLLYSYPFGGLQEVSPLTVKLCEEQGFCAAYMNIAEIPHWDNVNPNYILPRCSLPNEGNKYLLDAKLSGFEVFCKKIIKTSLALLYIKQSRAYGT